MQGDLEDYESRLSKYLDKYMRENQNLSEEKVYELKKLFLETLDKCITIFEEDVFMDISKDRPRRSVVYYDLLMWSFSKYDKDFLVRNKETLNKKFEEMCSLDEFQRTLSGGLQRKTSIIKRRELWEARMGELE